MDATAVASGLWAKIRSCSSKVYLYNRDAVSRKRIHSSGFAAMSFATSSVSCSMAYNLFAIPIHPPLILVHFPPLVCSCL
ncbi:MAG: hypothetical protein ACI4XO_01725, partial [Akkermansia sp.]